MHLRLVLALIFVACLTAMYGYSEAAPTERPYQFGFTIEKQQHRQEKKDERGIVMGEFGFITADGIYHVTVYATDEEGKFRILAMRSYPYEEHPKTIDMVVRPKVKPITTTTTERPKPKAIEKPNFSIQGCSGCFIKNNVPITSTTTQKPQEKKYSIRPLSQPLAPDGGPQIGKKSTPTIIERVQLAETKLKQTPVNAQSSAVKGIALGIDERKPVEGVEKTQNTQATTAKTLERKQKTQERKQKSKPATQNVSYSTQRELVKTRNAEAGTYEAQTTTQIVQSAKQPTQKPSHKSQEAKQKTQTAPPITPFATQTQKTTIPFNASLNTHTNPTFISSKKSPAPPSNTIKSGVAKTSAVGTINGANAPKVPAKGNSNALPNSLSAPSAGTIPTKPATTLVIPAGNTGGGKGNAGGGKSIAVGGTVGNRPNSSVGSGGGSVGKPNSGASSGSGGNGNSGRPSSSGGINGSAGETGDLYRFKYNLDYNGHRETGGSNGNKEGSFYAIGDDNVERTIEYIANEFGYQPRIRFRKLDTPVQAKENTLKDYEFVWFKKA